MRERERVTRDSVGSILTCQESRDLRCESKPSFFFLHSRPTYANGANHGLCRISLNWPSGLGFAGNRQPIFDHIFKIWIFNKSLSTKIMENHENFTYILYEQNISPCEFFFTHKIFKNSINKQSLIIIKSHILEFYLFIYFLLETK